jgi:hypothetical protein
MMGTVQSELSEWQSVVPGTCYIRKNGVEFEVLGVGLSQHG